MNLVDENIIDFRPTGSDQPVKRVLGVAYPGIPYQENGLPRTMSGQLINSVVQTSGPSGPGIPGDKDGTPWIGFAEPVSSVVGTLGPDGPGVPGNGYSQTWTRSEDPIYSVVCASGSDGSVDPAMRTARLGPDMPFHCIVRIIPQ